MAEEMTLYDGDIDDTTEGWVTTLQLALTRAGHAPQGGVDGKFGWRTKAAVVAFQQSMDFSDQGGVAGNQTWAALMGRDPEEPGTNNGLLELEQLGFFSTVLLTGDAPNTNGGLVMGRDWRAIDRGPARQADRSQSVGDTLTVGAAVVVWLDDDRSNDAGGGVRRAGSLSIIDGADESIGNAIIDGVISLSTSDSPTRSVASVGDLTANADSTISMVVDDIASDALEVRGGASIDGAILELDATRLTPGRFHTLISIDGTQPADGEFKVSRRVVRCGFGGADFEISYRAGDGNDIVIGPPSPQPPDPPPTTEPPPTPPPSNPPPPAETYAGVSPVRVLETRVSEGRVGYVGPRPVAGQIIELAVGGVAGVPVDAAAVVLNVTAGASRQRRLRHGLAVRPTRPTASNLNVRAGQTVANLVVTKLGSNGTVCLYSLAGIDLIADLQGWYPAGTYAGVSPVRVLERG